jgi:hypothetical protein
VLDGYAIRAIRIDGEELAEDLPEAGASLRVFLGSSLAAEVHYHCSSHLANGNGVVKALAGHGGQSHCIWPL